MLGFLIMQSIESSFIFLGERQRFGADSYIAVVDVHGAAFAFEFDVLQALARHRLVTANTKSCRLVCLCAECILCFPLPFRREHKWSLSHWSVCSDRLKLR